MATRQFDVQACIALALQVTSGNMPAWEVVWEVQTATPLKTRQEMHRALHERSCLGRCGTQQTRQDITQAAWHNTQDQV
eukprot:1234790-Amphidinium_carterae.1